MAVGIVFLDDTGRVWTVEAVYCPTTYTLLGLRFSHPTFIQPVESRFTDVVPTCWPGCDVDEFRAALRGAAPADA